MTLQIQHRGQQSSRAVSARPALVYVLGGQVHINFANIVSSLPHAQGDRLRGLAVTSAQRCSAIPELPTVAETPGRYEVVQWTGVLAPARMPSAIITKVNPEIDRILALPDMKARLAADVADPVGGTFGTFGAFKRA